MSYCKKVLLHRFPSRKHEVYALLRIFDDVCYSDRSRAEFTDECVDKEGKFWTEFESKSLEGNDELATFILGVGDRHGVLRPRELRDWTHTARERVAPIACTVFRFNVGFVHPIARFFC